MPDFVVFLGLVHVAHFLRDFVFQTDAMATGKSKSNSILLSHVSVYTMNLLLFAVIATILGVVSPQFLVFWVAVNGVLHFITDLATSRVASRLNAQGRTHGFFNVLGLDQLIHASTLLLSAYWLFVYSGLFV